MLLRFTNITDKKGFHEICFFCEFHEMFRLAAALILFYYFLINYLSFPGPTLRHWQGDSLTDLMQIATVYLI